MNSNGVERCDCGVKDEGRYGAEHATTSPGLPNRLTNFPGPLAHELDLLVTGISADPAMRLNHELGLSAQIIGIFFPWSFTGTRAPLIMPLYCKVSRGRRLWWDGWVLKLI